MDGSKKDNLDILLQTSCDPYLMFSPSKWQEMVGFINHHIHYFMDSVLKRMIPFLPTISFTKDNIPYSISISDLTLINKKTDFFSHFLNKTTYSHSLIIRYSAKVGENCFELSGEIAQVPVPTDLGFGIIDGFLVNMCMLEVYVYNVPLVLKSYKFGVFLKVYSTPEPDFIPAKTFMLVRKKKTNQALFQNKVINFKSILVLSSSELELVFPHIPTLQGKKKFLDLCVNIFQNATAKDDCSSKIEYRCVVTWGHLLARVLYNVLSLDMKKWSVRFKNDKKFISFSILSSSLRLHEHIKNFFRKGIIPSYSSKHTFRDYINGSNWIHVMSTLRRVCTFIDTNHLWRKDRVISEEQKYYYCPLETSEGHQSGSRKSLVKDATLLIPTYPITIDYHDRLGWNVYFRGEVIAKDMYPKESKHYVLLPIKYTKTVFISDMWGHLQRGTHIYGYLEEFMPYKEHNFSVRNIYGRNFLTQCINLPINNYNLRFLHYPQAFINSVETHGIGQYAILAICTFEGFGIEDGILVNKGSIDRGLFDMSHISKQKVSVDFNKPYRKIALSSSQYYCQDKTLEIGDKLATAHGQKGVVTAIIPEEDMPFDSDGIRPDIILNPHAIPSRKTCGQILEIVDNLKKMNCNKGLDNEGSLLIDGKTGKVIKNRIFMGPAYILRSVHLAIDKTKERTTGERNAMTNQPVSKRIFDGGLRIGEMEKDAFVTHGSMFGLHEKLTTHSDIQIREVCTVCKSIFCSHTEPKTQVQIPGSLVYLAHLSYMVGIHIKFEVG